MVELSAYELAAVAGGFGIAGTLIGTVTTYWLSMKLAKQQFSYLREVSRLDALHRSAGDFVDAFAEDVALLESGAALDLELKEYLREAYKARHRKAVSAFERFVPQDSLASFRTEWAKHCYGTDSNGKLMSPHDDDLGLGHDDLLFHHYGNEENLANPSLPRQRCGVALRQVLTYARVI